MKQQDVAPSLYGAHLGVTDDLSPSLRDGIEARKQILYDFALSPADDTIWGHVYEMVLSEALTGEGQPEPLRTVAGSDLISLAEDVRNTSPESRYDFMTQTAPNGKVWFENLPGFTSPSCHKAIANNLHYTLQRSNRSKFGTIVDLGSGIGNTAATVEPYSVNTLSIDRNISLLKVAKDKHSEIRFLGGDVTQLPIADSSADIVVSGGLRYSLNGSDSQLMYREISRILKPGGKYLDASWEAPERIVLSVHPMGGVEKPDYHPEHLASFVTWRAVLQDMIVDTTSGKLELADSLDTAGAQWNYYLEYLGLTETSEKYIDGFVSRLAKTRVLQKTN